MADSDGDDDRSGAARLSTQKSPPLLPRRTSPSAPAICPRAMVYDVVHPYAHPCSRSRRIESRRRRRRFVSAMMHTHCAPRPLRTRFFPPSAIGDFAACAAVLTELALSRRCRCSRLWSRRRSRCCSCRCCRRHRHRPCRRRSSSCSPPPSSPRRRTVLSHRRRGASALASP